MKPIADVRTLSRVALLAAQERSGKHASKINQAFIDAGRGYETFSDTRAKSDDLAVSYCAAMDQCAAFNRECERRMTYHGKLTPTKAI